MGVCVCVCAGLTLLVLVKPESFGYLDPVQYNSQSVFTGVIH